VDYLTRIQNRVTHHNKAYRTLSLMKRKL